MLINSVDKFRLKFNCLSCSKKFLSTSEPQEGADASLLPNSLFKTASAILLVIFYLFKMKW